MRKIRINQIKGYEDIKPYYWIDEFGTCWNENTGKKLKILINEKYKYPRYQLYTINKTRKDICIHRILAQAFIPNPNNYPVVRHLNDNKNDWRIENLVWGTTSDNIQDSIKNNRHGYGIKIHNNKLIICVETGIIYKSSCEASRKLKISQSGISLCCLNKRKTAGGYHFKYIEEV